jgi:hypothetical protein
MKLLELVRKKTSYRDFIKVPKKGSNIIEI